MATDGASVASVPGEDSVPPVASELNVLEEVTKRVAHALGEVRASADATLGEQRVSASDHAKLTEVAELAAGEVQRWLSAESAWSRTEFRALRELLSAVLDLLLAEDQYGGQQEFFRTRISALIPILVADAVSMDAQKLLLVGGESEDQCRNPIFLQKILRIIERQFLPSPEEGGEQPQDSVHPQSSVVHSDSMFGGVLAAAG